MTPFKDPERIISVEEAVRTCPICQAARQHNKEHGTKIVTPVCLYNARYILPGEKHKCSFAKYADRRIGLASCDICGREIPFSRFIVDVHDPPKPNVGDMHVCPWCLNKPENAILRKKAGLE